MELIVAVIGGGCVAFLLRFLFVVHRETRSVLPLPGTVVPLEQGPPAGGKVVMMKGLRQGGSREIGAKGGRRVVTIAMAAALLTWSLRGQAQTAEPAASAEEVRQLRQLVQQLQERVTQLEAEQGKKADVESTERSGALSGPAKQTSSLNFEDRGVLDFFHATTINFGIDGYYGYNFNRPIGRQNLLRAYDVSSNSFSLNQANLVFEQAPDVASDRRFGARLDLQFGQATETVQGNSANELRPQVYRPVWQAYGTYVAPLGKGLTLDFGKWASPLGIETNYTKDQFNYSRSYYFDFLPFYHMGFRISYPVNDVLTIGYAAVNGIQQTEDFNGFKSQMVALTIRPVKSVTWNINYHFGQEQRDAAPGEPTPDGRLHILDTNVTWNVNPKVTLSAEGDYVINRVFSHSAPQHVDGGALYARYQWTPRSALAARAEYLSDRGGLFSGTTQALKETTLTYEYKLAEGFLMRSEWRRDFSNQPYFLTEIPGVLKKEQNTATVGLVWWLGRKQGSW